MSHIVSKDIGPNTFCITFSPGVTNKQVLDSFRAKLTEKESGNPKWGWEDHDFGYDALGSFVVKALNADNTTYKYVSLYPYAGRLMIRLCENWNTTTHSSTKWCEYQADLINLGWGNNDSIVVGKAYHPYFTNTDRQSLVVSANRHWLMYDIKPFSKVTSYLPLSGQGANDDKRTSAIGVFEVDQTYSEGVSKTYLANLIALTGLFTEKIAALSNAGSGWSYDGTSFLYPPILQPTDTSAPPHSVAYSYFGEYTRCGVSTDRGPILGNSINALGVNFTKNELFNGTSKIILHLGVLNNALIHAATGHSFVNGVSVAGTATNPATPLSYFRGLKIGNTNSNRFDVLDVKCNSDFMLDETGSDVPHMVWVADTFGQKCDFYLPL